VESRFRIFEFYAFYQYYKFWGVLTMSINPIWSTLKKICYASHFIYNFIIDIFSKSNYFNDVLLMFDPSYIWIYIFWNLNISIITMLNPSKVSFSLRNFELLKTYFWIMNAFCVCNMVKHSLNIIGHNHKNEFQKWKAMIILYFYFVQNGTLTPNKKRGVCMLWFTQKISQFDNF